MTSHVLLFPSDLGGCGQYRISYPAQTAQRDRPDRVRVTVAAPGSVIGTMGRRVREPAFATRRAGRRATGGRERFEVVKAPELPADIDTVVLQRVTSEEIAGVIEHWRADGIRVVVDIDDDLSAIHPSNPAFQGYHPAYSPRDNWDHLKAACRAATLVTVTTPALARRYGGHGRVEVIPNCVPAGALGVRRRERIDERLTVGWTGTAATHGGDLEATGGGVAQALRDYDGRVAFRVVGAGQQVADRLGLDMAEATGWLDMRQYYDQYGQLDVAIVPLGETAFNEAKSDLKGLEACAVGTPFVASPTGPYRALVAEGVGRLAAKNRAKDWRGALLGLLRDPGARADMAAAGRAYAATRTFEANVDRWVDAWTG